MPKRTESEVYLADKIDATELVKFIEQKNTQHDNYRTTIFHCFVLAIARMIRERPKMNRYVQGRRMYERDSISLSFMAKRRFADECIQLAERFIPGLSDKYDRRYISTPLTWCDYVATPDGSAYGIRKDYHQPLMTILSPRTSIPNLLLTGQSLVVHGLQGVTQTAFNTCSEILGKDYIQQILKI